MKKIFVFLAFLALFFNSNAQRFSNAIITVAFQNFASTKTSVNISNKEVHITNCILTEQEIPKNTMTANEAVELASLLINSKDTLLDASSNSASNAIVGKWGVITIRYSKVDSKWVLYYYPIRIPLGTTRIRIFHL